MLLDQEESFISNKWSKLAAVVKRTGLTSKHFCHGGSYQKKKKVVMTFQKTWNTLVLGIIFSLGLLMEESERINWEQPPRKARMTACPQLSMLGTHRKNREYAIQRSIPCLISYDCFHLFFYLFILHYHSPEQPASSNLEHR